jgi:hypothetical protein
MEAMNTPAMAPTKTVPIAANLPFVGLPTAVQKGIGHIIRTAQTVPAGGLFPGCCGDKKK